VTKLVSQLSGGEAQRLSLALLVSSDSNVLILDEPTNHLDLESREALEDALSRFNGTLLLVSHDRAMLEAVGTRTVAVEDQKLRVFNGGWSEYREREAEQAERDSKRGQAPLRKGSDAARGAEARKARAQERAAVADVRKLENEIEAAEAALAKLEEELSDPSAWSDARIAAKSTRRHDAAKEKVRELTERWEALS
jgi:ATP-binding cassette subfamily F protein 3